jgi:hypothetical protein
MPKDPLHQELYTLDGLTYTVTVREVKGAGYQGERTCGQCQQTGAARTVARSVRGAVGAAKGNLHMHHVMHLAPDGP